MATFTFDWGSLDVGVPQVCVEEFTSGQWLWFPKALRWTTGEILLYTVGTADNNDIDTTVTKVYRSTTGLPPYTRLADMDEFSGAGGDPVVRVGDSFVGPSYQVKNVPFTDANLVAESVRRQTFSNRGLTYDPGAYTVQILGIPRPVPIYLKLNNDHSLTRWTSAYWFGSTLRLRSGAFLSTLIVTHPGDPATTLYCVRSEDFMQSWYVTGTIATPASAYIGTEGVDEPTLYQMANGDIGCVSRTGQNYPAFAKSTDEGKTWTDTIGVAPLQFMPGPGFVAPSALRFDRPDENGCLVVVTGRQGQVLLIAPDGRGDRNNPGSGSPDRSWSTWELHAYHNSLCPFAYLSHPGETGLIRQMNSLDVGTTGYGSAVWVARNTIRWFYDVTPSGRDVVGGTPGIPNQIMSVDVTVNLT